jgi:hypothetical protein
MANFKLNSTLAALFLFFRFSPFLTDLPPRTLIAFLPNVQLRAFCLRAHESSKGRFAVTIVLIGNPVRTAYRNHVEGRSTCETANLRLVWNVRLPPL